MALYKNNKQDGSTILIAGTGGVGSINIDSALSMTSENPVQNKIISTEIKTINDILYKKYINYVTTSSNLTLTIDKDLKLYDKIIVISKDDTEKNVIINYTDNTQETIAISKTINPTIFVKENFSSVIIPEYAIANIYRCIDENEIHQLQTNFKQLKKQIDNTYTELEQTGIMVTNLIYDLDFSFGTLDEDGSELVNKLGVVTTFSLDKEESIVIKSNSTNMTVKLRYEDINGESQFESYLLNQENEYTQKVTFIAGYEYKIAFSFSPEVEITNTTDITNKVGIYISNDNILMADYVPMTNGNGTWSWKNPESEIQKSQLSWNGLTIEFYKQGRIAWMKASGTLSADLAINNAFADIIIPSNSFKPTVNDTMDVISGLYRFQVNAVEGTGFRIGQGKILSTETGTDITTGTELHFNRTYIC